MRIIAGRLGGLTFDSPPGKRTHPMSEKVRGALFNSLGDIDGLNVLDAFAGSGALGFEAISRGVSKVVAIEKDKKAKDIIDLNISRLNLDNIKVIRANASGWSDLNAEAKFDIVLLDPPYNDLQISLLQKLFKHASQDGLVVLSWPGSHESLEFIGAKLIDKRSYGDIQLVFYRKIT